MAKTTKSRYAILGILAGAPGSSGYDIQSMMKVSTDFFWKETFSSIYPVLDSLDREGLISAVEASRVGRKRKSYKITKKGQGVLASWLKEDVELEQARNELLLKIFFGEMNSLESNIQHLKNYQHQIVTRKARLEDTRINVSKDYADEASLPYWLLTIEFGIRRLEASIAWADFAIAKLSKMRRREK